MFSFSVILLVLSFKIFNPSFGLFITFLFVNDLICSFLFSILNLTALFAQRQRWAEGGLQRFFDYGDQLLTKKIDNLQKFDVTYFFILQYGLPIILSYSN